MSDKPECFGRDGRGEMIQRPTYDLEHIDDDGHVVPSVESPFEWQCARFRILIEPPFFFDGASVPMLVWPVLDANRYDLTTPSLPHDYLYRPGAVVFDFELGRERETTQLEADGVISRICGDRGVGYFDRMKIYYALRAVGGLSYHDRPMDWGAGLPFA